MKTDSKKCILFDDDDQTFEISYGSKGSYAYKDIKKSQIVYEQAKYHNEKNPFPCAHRFLVTTHNFNWVNPKTYVGLEIELQDQKKIYLYISNEERTLLSDSFKEDVRQAKEIKKMIDQRRMLS